MQTVKELMNLGGRVALITGGAGHIGISIAQALAELGAKIAILDREKQSIDSVLGEIKGRFSVETLPIAADLEDGKELSTVPGKILDRFGRLDILVNCAALVGTSKLEGWATTFEKQSAETWRRALEVNLTAPFALIQSSAVALAESGHGSVINIGSTYGVVGPDMSLYEGTTMGNPAAYAASKGGLLQLTRWLATVMAPKVRVNAISPGGVSRAQPQKFVERYVEKTPLKRMATEEDFKGAIAFLASDLSAYMTGQNLMVDGGWTAW